MFVDAANIGDASGPCTQPEMSFLDTRKRFHAAMQSASFDDLVESFPRSCPSESLYFPYVSGYHAHQHAVSCGKCLQSMTLKLTSSPDAPHGLWWRRGRAQCGSRIAFMSKTFFGASIHTSLPSLVRLLYAYCHDWGVREGAHECKLSPDNVIRWCSRFRSLCANALDGLLIDLEGMVVEVTYQQIHAAIRRIQENNSQRPFPLFGVFPAIFLPAVSVH
jgi:hypothetical protein